jgi:hypothetical protein
MITPLTQSKIAAKRARPGSCEIVSTRSSAGMNAGLRNKVEPQSFFWKDLVRGAPARLTLLNVEERLCA